MKHVDLTGPCILQTRCWVWTGATFYKGYGNFRVSASKNINAHRWLWEHENGPIPTGLKLCHRCDNPPCVRPSHMFIGTQRSNLDDMRRKNRQGDNRNFAERNGSAKLAWDQVRLIRSRHADGETVAALARSYDVTYQNVRMIVRCETWRE